MIINMLHVGGYDIICDPTLANNSPAQIRAAAKLGIASTLWSVGDRTALIPLSASTALPNMIRPSGIRAYIIGFDHNSSIEGTGITFMYGVISNGWDVALCDSGYGAEKTSGTWFNMNNSKTNSGGWASSRMRTVVCPAFLSALPSEWQNIIAETTKYTDNTGNKSTAPANVTATQDKIFILAEWEVFGARTYANETEKNYQAQYQYYINGNSKKKHRNTSSDLAQWSGRSAGSAGTSNFRSVGTDGTNTTHSASTSIGFAPAFRVG